MRNVVDSSIYPATDSRSTFSCWLHQKLRLGRIIAGGIMKFATNDTLVRAKIGERRCFYSMRIHEALRRNGRTATVIAYELKVSLSAVSATILGKNHSARILDALRDAGVPDKYLFDPRYPERWTEKETAA